MNEGTTSGTRTEGQHAVTRGRSRSWIAVSPGVVVEAVRQATCDQCRKNLKCVHFTIGGNLDTRSALCWEHFIPAAEELQWVSVVPPPGPSEHPFGSDERGRTWGHSTTKTPDDTGDSGYSVTRSEGASAGVGGGLPGPYTETEQQGDHP